MNHRIKKAHMKSAFNYAELSYCKRLKVGCVVVHGDSIISIGYNGTPPGEDNDCETEHWTTKPNVIHAEDNALRKLKRREVPTKGTTFFLTHAPCLECAKKLVKAKVECVYYDDLYRLNDGIIHLQENGIKVEQLKISNNK